MLFSVSAAGISGSVLLALLVTREFYQRSYPVVLFALFCSLLGWGTGILLAPYSGERDNFARVSKTLVGFVAGFGASNFYRVVAAIANKPPGSILSGSSYDLVLGASCLLLITISVFVARSYP
jgi:hypothetical protein